MNYLAHLLLSGPDPDWRLGGLLGDFVKGPLTGERPAAIEAGIRLHRRLDAGTDQHPAYRAALAQLDPRWRRYAGIALDIWFDHLLALQWPQRSSQPLDDFCDQCWRDFHVRSRYIPPRAQAFIARAEQFKLLPGYRERDVIARTLERVGQRLRRPVPLEQLLPQLVAAAEPLQCHFEQLFADLEREASVFRQRYNIGNE